MAPRQPFQGIAKAKEAERIIIRGSGHVGGGCGSEQLPSLRQARHEATTIGDLR